MVELEVRTASLTSASLSGAFLASVRSTSAKAILRGGSVCLNRDRQRISGSSAGCFFELPIWGVKQGGRSPTGVTPQIGGQIHAAIFTGRLSKYA